MIRTIIFDLDGTLIESLTSIVKSMNYLLEKEGYPSHPFESYRMFVGDGVENMVHGGILSTVLDEVMVKSANSRGYTCVTAELNVRYKNPCKTGMEYELKGRVSEVTKRLILTEGEIIDKHGVVIASGSGKLFIVAKKEHGEK